MAAIASSILLEEAKCYFCFITDLSIARGIKLALLARTLIALVPTANTTPQALLAYANCYGCYGATLYDMIELALLDQIAQAA